MEPILARAPIEIPPLLLPTNENDARRTKAHSTASVKTKLPILEAESYTVHKESTESDSPIILTLADGVTEKVLDIKEYAEFLSMVEPAVVGETLKPVIDLPVGKESAQAVTAIVSKELERTVEIEPGTSFKTYQSQNPDGKKVVIVENEDTGEIEKLTFAEYETIQTATS